MIKAIIFDIGGVLLRTHDHHYRHRWDERLGLPLGTVEEVVFNSEVGQAAQLGHITTRQLWQAVGDRFNLEEGALKQLKHEFWVGDVLDSQLVALIRRLHKEYMTAVISNYSDILPHLINQEWQMASDFDLLIVSSTAGVMKPEAKIYQLAMDELGIEPEEAVFIDDFAHNIDGARAIGMRGIHFTEGVNLEDELTKLGIQIPD